MNPLVRLLPLPAALICSIALSAEFKINHQTFTVPDGFEVELVAGPSLVERPVSASFDDQGRLYVTDSSGSNEKPDKQVLNPTHRVRRLEDTDGDGRFDKSVVFADKVMFPEGCLWYDGSVYVAGPPSIWKFTDTDGDGVADKREEWWKGGTLTGCANDVHGPYLGPDGYLYWTKGAFAEQTHKLGNGHTLNDRAAHIYRARPDGSDLDVVMTGGMDNPVEVAFTPEGEVIFTSTFIDFTQPGYRDGIGHAVYGAVFGKQNDVLEDGRVKRTGPDLMHPFYEAGPAAECALCRYESDAFGPGYHDNFFATTFNLHKVTRHILRPKGATYASTDSDFLVSDSVDFHPTDVLADADGSLLVVDTGGWYKLCCPSSQLAKPDVLGAIYRVRPRAASALSSDDARKISYYFLTSPPPMAAPPKEDSRFTLKVTGEKLAAQLKQAIWKRDEESAAWFRETLAKAALGAPDDSESAHIARLAAEGLGRIRDRAGIPVLLKAARFIDDPVLECSLIYALIEIGDSAETRPGLKDAIPRVQRAALIALDQMDDGNLKASDVLTFLNASDERLRSAAGWIVGHHPDWGGALAGFFRDRLADKSLSDTDREALQHQLAQLARNSAIQDLLGDCSANTAKPKEVRLVALRAMAQASLKDAPHAWTNALSVALGDADDAIAQAAIGAIRALPTGKDAMLGFDTDLERVGRSLSHSADTRLDALAALRGKLKPVEPDLFDFLRSNLDSTKPPMTRAAAATVIGRSDLSDDQLLALADASENVGPLELSRLVAAFDKTTTETVGLKLVAALKASKGLRGLRTDQLEPLLAKFPDRVQKEGEALLASLNADAAKQKAHLEELSTSLPQGDIRRGQAVFNSPKAACSSCHKIGYLGGLVGPDLTSIGQARTERDLLESIVYPSASFVRSYEPMVVATRSGDEYSGVLKKDTPDEIMLATGPNTEARIARSDIAEIRPGTVSVMPAGLDEQLSRQELADLVAFLKGTKWGPQ